MTKFFESVVALGGREQMQLAWERTCTNWARRVDHVSTLEAPPLDDLYVDRLMTDRLWKVQWLGLLPGILYVY